MTVKEFYGFGPRSGFSYDAEGIVFTYERSKALAQRRGILNEEQPDAALLVQARSGASSSAWRRIIDERTHLRVQFWMNGGDRTSHALAESAVGGLLTLRREFYRQRTRPAA